MFDEAVARSLENSEFLGRVKNKTRKDAECVNFFLSNVAPMR